ncbi:DUF4062 domain-containing protein [Hymenobacter sp. CRA2]|uniref:DUF4062 domain-containing protein n=1 Tax=Hymenobacter sp. CRA2 TaxID=1955620 RepID=UPI00098EFD4F|nr:DUF4062 domain-containing protein [Hymenobacter sp. CRA2]OON69106.1 hypothetical protein B0919_10375 [Hymenobacter sp. CRA2]
MKPRVFISSTYYDLKYVRENLEHFIKQYGFDSVLFESGNVTFEHGKKLDISCYNEVDLCQLMILIVGGRYGSASSNESQAKIRKKYDEQYISITRKEFETAQKNGIPIFVFIDKNVHSEYQTFKRNEEIFNSLKKDFEKKHKHQKDEKYFDFAYVDSTNVFKFIDAIIHLPTKTFEKSEEIIEYLRSQLAGMFFLYLDQLKRESTNKEILSSVTELNNAVSKIDIIIEALGRQVIEKDKLKEVEEKQRQIEEKSFLDALTLFMGQIKEGIDSTDLLDNTEAEQLAKALINDFFNKDFQNYESLIKTLKLILLDLPFHERLTIAPKIYSMHRTYNNIIKPLLNTQARRNEFKKQLESRLELPF